MNIYQEFQEILKKLTAKYTIPPISQVFFPPFFQGGQPKECEFIGIALEGGACGISYVLLPDQQKESYQSSAISDFSRQSPVELAGEFGADDPVKSMVGLAALNAVCQHVMKTTRLALDLSSDSLGLLNIQQGDKVGMIGLFRPLIQRVENQGAHLTIFENKEKLIDKYPQYNITLDLTSLSNCNKVLCTSTTVYNNTLDNILKHCSAKAFVSVIGPTAGYFPDPLFSRGVDVVGGSFIVDGETFMQRIGDHERWGNAVSKFCFQKTQYAGLPL